MDNPTALEKARELRDKRTAAMKELSARWFKNKPEDYAKFGAEYEQEPFSVFGNLDAAALKRAFASGVRQYARVYSEVVENLEREADQLEGK